MFFPSVAADINEVVAARFDWGDPIPARMAAIWDHRLVTVGKGKYARILSFLSTGSTEPDSIRPLLSIHDEFAYITVEVNVLDNSPGGLLRS